MPACRNAWSIAVCISWRTLKRLSMLGMNSRRLNSSELSPNLLKDRPIAQYRFGEAEAKLRAARAYLFEAMEAVEEELRGGRETPGPETTPNGRLACIPASLAWQLPVC